MIGKFVEETPESESRAEQALERALQLNPELSVAHKYVAYLEGDIGHSHAALLRLLGQADRYPDDPELFAGLVSACRYCGLYDESIAAHIEARRLDPHVQTSLGHTLLLAGELERLVAVERPPRGTSVNEWLHCRATGLGLARRWEEARDGLVEMREAPHVAAFAAAGDFLMAWVDHHPANMLSTLSTLRSLTLYADPEFLFRVGWLLCDVCEYEQGLIYLRRAVDKGYWAVPPLSTAPAFDALRSEPRFSGILADAKSGRQRAMAAFRKAGGRQLLREEATPPHPTR